MKYKECKNKQKIIRLAIVLLLISIILITIGILNLGKNEKNDINSVSLDYEYLTVTDKGEYIISGADTNISFEVTEDTVFEILDENNKKVDAKIIDNKIVNSNGYEKGAKYILTIESGSFVSEQLKDVDTVTFKIARDEVRKYKIKDDVIKLNVNDIQVSDNKLMAENLPLVVNDVLLVYDGEVIKDAYVITGIDIQGNYEVEEAQLNQIYSELDFYYEEYADLSNFDTSEQIKEYVILSAKQSEWYEAIIETVHAEPELKVELKSVENGIEATVTVAIAAGDDSLLLSSDYHDFEFSYTQVFQVKTLSDITLTNWDISIQIINKQGFNFKISNKAIDYNEPMSKKLVNKIQEAINNKTNFDSDEKELQLVTIPIPTPVPGLSFQVELGLMNQVEMSIFLETGFSVTNIITVGFDYGAFEEFKPLSSYNFDASDFNVKFGGKIECKAGIKIEAQLDLVGLLEAGIAASGGLYGEASVLFDYTVNKKTKLSFDISLGLFVELSLELEIAKVQFEYKLLEEKFPLFEKSLESGFTTITFNSNGGNTIEEQDVSLGGKLKKPQDPIKEGYIFDYWELDGKKYDFNSEVSDSFELIAVWKKISDDENVNEDEDTDNNVIDETIGENSGDLSDVKKKMEKLNNYSYDVEITTKSDFMDLTVTMNCKEDVNNQISYCYSSIYSVVSEEYVDYLNKVSYSRVTSPFGGDSNNGVWTSTKYTGDSSNNWVGLSEYISNATAENKDGGTYYNGTIDSDMIAGAMAEVDPEMDSSSIISEDIKISVFVNSSNYIEKISFSMVVAGIQEDVVIYYKDFNTSGSLQIPSDAK